MKANPSSTPLIRIALLTCAAVGIHGYHLGTDDAAIYIPAVKKVVNPALYPFGSEFFLAHAKLSQFAAVVGGTARVTHFGTDLVIFLWYVATVFAFLLAVWQLAAVCFHSERARWSALLSLTALMTIPAAGTALVLMDPYVTARSASTPLTVFAVAAFLAGNRRQSTFWILLAALVHPLMAASAIVFLGILALCSRRHLATSGSSPTLAPAAFAIPGGYTLAPVPLEYRQVLDMRPFLFLSRWTWYEWIGLAFPLAFLLWPSRAVPHGASPAYARVRQAAGIFGLLATLAATVLSSSHLFDNYARLQPLRAFHLIYLIFFLLLGGLLGEYVLKGRYWLSAIAFGGIAAGMFLIQRNSYPASPQVEWPWTAPANPWVSAFLWVRGNTPTDAVFALDPKYVTLPGEDGHGFRAIAERSMLSDYRKDSGVVSLFPGLALEWHQQQQAQQGWRQFTLADFQQLATRYPVSWVVVPLPAPGGLDCPYRNQAVTVCHIPGAAGLQPPTPHP